MQLQLRLSDLLQVERPDLPPVPLAPRDAVMLAWLALEGPTARDRLGGLLWPGSSEQRARSALRQRIFQLHKTLGTAVVGGAAQLALAEKVGHDLLDATVLLADLAFPDAPELDAWLNVQRERQQAREREALHDQAQALEDAGEVASALRVAQALLRGEPLSEAAHRRVIRLHYLNGDRSGALLAFDRMERVLKDDVGVRPAAESLALLATIDGSDLQAVPARLREVPISILRPPRMIGRDREMLTLMQAWHGLKVAAVVGEAGMGKTRLLGELSGAVTGLARASGRPGDAGIPYATLARLLGQVDTEAARRRSTGAGHPLAHFLPDLGAATAQHAEGQRLRLLRGIAECLRGVAGLVVDDLHFADAASLDLMQSLIVECESLRWAVAYRPAEAGSPLQALEAALAEAARIAPVVVEPLGERALAELVDQLDLGLAGSAIAPRLLQRTGGNPLFVLETLKQAWVEQGLETLGAGSLLPTPVSVTQLINHRIARLSAPALALARVASLAGVDFSLQLAENVLQTNAILLIDALNELESAQVLKGLQFAHDLVLDAVLRSVPAVVAADAHVKVAQWLEAHEGEPARIARHWVDAGEPAAALPWLGRAARQAEAALRAVEQTAFLDEKAAIEEKLGRMDECFDTTLHALEATMGYTYDSQRLLPRFDRVEALAHGPAHRIRVEIARARTHMHRREPVAAEAAIRRAIDHAHQWGDADWLGRCQVTLVELMVQAERISDAHHQALVCRRWIETDADLEWQARYFGATATIFESTGRIEQARESHEHALSLAERLGQHENQSVAANNLALNRREAGEIRRAIELGQQSLRLSSRYAAGQGGTGPACVNLAEACLQLGRYNEALHWAGEAERILAGSIPNAVPLAWAHQASTYLHLGQPARTRQLVDRIAAHPASFVPARVRMHLLTARLRPRDPRAAMQALQAGLALLPSGGRAGLRSALQIEMSLHLPGSEALELLDQVRSLAADQGRGGHVLEAHVRAAVVAAGIDADAAGRHVFSALSLSEKLEPVSIYRGLIWLNCGEALLAIGDRQQAQRVLRDGANWVRLTADTEVPPSFRESFLLRNAANASLLTLASRFTANT